MTFQLSLQILLAFLNNVDKMNLIKSDKDQTEDWFSNPYIPNPEMFKEQELLQVYYDIGGLEQKQVSHTRQHHHQKQQSSEL